MCRPPLNSIPRSIRPRPAAHARLAHADQCHGDREATDPAAGKAAAQLPQKADHGQALEHVHLVEEHNPRLGRDLRGPVVLKYRGIG